MECSNFRLGRCLSKSESETKCVQPLSLSDARKVKSRSALGDNRNHCGEKLETNFEMSGCVASSMFYCCRLALRLRIISDFFFLLEVPWGRGTLFAGLSGAIATPPPPRLTFESELGCHRARSPGSGKFVGGGGNGLSFREAEAKQSGIQSMKIEATMELTQSSY